MNELDYDLIPMPFIDRAYDSHFILHLYHIMSLYMHQEILFRSLFASFYYITV